MESIESIEAAIVHYFNPSITSLDQVPTRAWPMVYLREALTAVGLYLVFVLVGSWIQRKSPEEKELKGLLKFIMVVYNLTQVALCTYMLSAAIMEYRRKDYKLACNSFNISETGMASVTWVFYMSKILDFLDTVFIIIRRKWKQLSFLHLYHHSTIFMFYWLNINAGYDGDVYFTIVLNCLVHMLMYAYYAASTMKLYVPVAVKQMVTHCQRVQFVLMISQAIYILYNQCAFPPRIIIWYSIYISSLLALFTDFDRKTYSAKGGKNAAGAAAKGSVTASAPASGRKVRAKAE